MGKAERDSHPAHNEPASRIDGLRQALGRPISPGLQEEPLESALQWIADAARLPIFLDRASLRDEGVALDSPVTARFTNLPARSVLDLILDPLQLGYDFRDDVVFVTTKTQLEEHLTIQMYDVADLVLRTGSDGTASDDFDQLMRALTTCVEPDSWQSLGGRGSMQHFRADDICVLIVRQTQALHEQVAAFLNALRSHRVVRERRAAPAKTSLASATTPQKQSTAVPFFASSGLTPAAAPVSPVALTESALQVAAGCNQFGCELYGQFRQQTSGNLFFSPYSISSVLAMAYAGAGGATADEIATALHSTLPAADYHRAFSVWRSSLERPDARRGLEVRSANGLWSDDRVSFRETYVDLAKNHYGGTVRSLDFSQPVDAARVINTWVSDQTNGRIRQLVQPGELSQVVLALTNAVYFNGTWQQPFEPLTTRPAQFDTGSGSLTVPLMVQKTQLAYAEEDGVQIVEKPYSTGEYSMIVLLPKKGREPLADLESRLSSKNLEQWLSRLRRREVRLQMPRFTFESRTNLNETLQSLGIRTAFGPNADFNGMLSSAGRLLTVLHAGFVRVDERGTEAAAATGGGFGGEPEAVVDFRADHPFLFLIRNRASGAILFLGRLVRPEP